VLTSNLCTTSACSCSFVCSSFCLSAPSVCPLSVPSHSVPLSISSSPSVFLYLSLPVGFWLCLLSLLVSSFIPPSADRFFSSTELCSCYLCRSRGEGGISGVKQPVHPFVDLMLLIRPEPAETIRAAGKIDMSTELHFATFFGV
jgi:hypothetical protein